MQVFGVVEEKEGLDTLAKINEAYADDKGRPFKDIRFVLGLFYHKFCH